MKVGEYVRTDTGRIAKIKNIIDYGKDNEFEYLNYNDVCVLTTENDYNHDVVGCRGRIIKSSPNIIDLIEVGDYVNGHKVVDIVEAPKRAVCIEDIKQKSGLIPYTRDNITSILTKEQFESMEYKVC